MERIRRVVLGPPGEVRDRAISVAQSRVGPSLALGQPVLGPVEGPAMTDDDGLGEPNLPTDIAPMELDGEGDAVR